MLQAMQGVKVSTAKLKEDIKVQNHTVYVEKSHIGKQLSCAHGADAMIKRQEIEDLQKKLSELRKKKLLEQHAHRTVQDHFDELQSTMVAITASWGNKMEIAADSKSNTLEVIQLWSKVHGDHAHGRQVDTHGVIQELRQKHKVLLGQFKEIEAAHTRESSLKLERDSKAQAAADAQEEKRIRDKIEGAAAARIQAHWRGYKTRVGAKGGKEKGKKKKK